jgi:predicted nucleic acid-binding protein
MVIVDTASLIALFSVSDSCHERAVKDFEKLMQDGEIFVVTNLVIQELVTIINLRYKELSKKIFLFVENILKNKEKGFIYRFADEADFLKTFKILSERNFLKLSFVDCSLLTISQQYNSARLLSYDKYLIKVFVENRNI